MRAVVLPVLWRHDLRSDVRHVRRKEAVHPGDDHLRRVLHAAVAVHKVLPAVSLARNHVRDR